MDVADPARGGRGRMPGVGGMSKESYFVFFPLTGCFA